jgi:hypothetical protein
MCEAHPCTDEPDGTSVAPSRPALNGQAEQEIALDAADDGGLPSEIEKPPFTIATVPVGSSNMLRGDKGAVSLILTRDQITSSRPERP